MKYSVLLYVTTLPATEYFICPHLAGGQMPPHHSALLLRPAGTAPPEAALRALDWVASLQYTGCDALALGGIVSYGGDVHGEIASWGTGAALLAFYRAAEILEES